MMTPEMERARGQFLSATYGKFDFIARIIPKDLVQIGKPRIIKQWLINHLEIPAEEINYSTLCSWFIRYRKLKGYTQKGMTGQGSQNEIPLFAVREQRTEIEQSGFILKKVTGK
jgi:hypothetical protein